MRRPERSVECSDSEKNMSAFADQNHAPSLTCVRLEYLKESFLSDKITIKIARVKKHKLNLIRGLKRISLWKYKIYAPLSRQWKHRI